MKRSLLLLCLLLPFQVVADEPTAGERLHQLFDAEWSARMDASPEFAAALGDHDRAGELSSYSAVTLAKQNNRTLEFLAELDAIPADQLSDEDRIHAAIFRAQLENRVAE